MSWKSMLTNHTRPKPVEGTESIQLLNKREHDISGLTISYSKVVTILHELGVPYIINSFKFDDVKKPPFIYINPNGRVPAIEDPNTDLTLWESGAIVHYLEEVYDKEKKLTYSTFKERHLLNQWLHFQVSGQGPYYGQAGWFTVLHHEKIPSAIERYQEHVRRVLGVLNTALDGKQWLVGDKCTYADLAFLPWNNRLNMLLETPAGEDPLAPYPNVQAWQHRMEARESWKKAMEVREVYMNEQGLQTNGMPLGVNNVKEYEELIAKNAREAEAART
ncbi:glutathione transferase [Histoplasma capsulatum H143]|uniref:glutathione transferase n=1 Tax=Ajellomyces capsulatus (strain H143) TaxID=544712 RepID=C6HNT5_AJECH|nr:glutathione transferase [Histoplasma capsulatum H143]